MKACREITRLTAKEQDGTLTTGEKIELRLHTLMCHKCRHYRRQTAWLQQQLQKLK